MENFKFDFGDLVEGKITGIRGIVLQKSIDYLGIKCYVIKSRELGLDGEYHAGEYTERSLSLVERQCVDFEITETEEG
jgi:hypothetical protein